MSVIESPSTATAQISALPPADVQAAPLPATGASTSTLLAPDSLATRQTGLVSQLQSYRAAAEDALAHPEHYSAQELSNAHGVVQELSALDQAEGQLSQMSPSALQTPEQNAALRTTLLSAGSPSQTSQLAQQLGAYHSALEKALAHPETMTPQELLNAMLFRNIMTTVDQGDSALSQQATSFYEAQRETDRQAINGNSYYGTA